MGGFARRMSYWKAFAKKYPSVPFLRVDGGSIFVNGVAEAPVLNRWTLEGTYRCGLDALNLSAWDLPVWQEMADLTAAGQIPKEFLDVPLVSANVTAKLPNFPRLRRYVIKEHSIASGNRVRIGVTGLLYDPQDRISRSEFEIRDPQAAVRQVMEEIRDKTDYRVVLTDMDIGKAMSLAIVVPGIDLLLVAHNYEVASEPQQVGDTLVVIPVNEGRMFSEVRMNFGPAAGKARLVTRFVPLDRTVPDDPEMGELVRKAQAEMDNLRKGKSLH